MNAGRPDWINRHSWQEPKREGHEAMKLSQEKPANFHGLQDFMFAALA
jgi:hypothetical protein